MRTARSLIIYREQSGRENLRSLFSQDLRKFEEDERETGRRGWKGGVRVTGLAKGRA